MEEQMVKSKKRKQTNGQPKVVCNWSYSEETTPGYRKLMSRLLQQRSDQMEMDNGNKNDATE